LINRVVLMVVMSPQQPLALTLIEMVMTIVFFPLVIVIAQFVFGVARPALGQVDSRGHRL
jgi:rod shape-determining protein MreD